MSLEHRAFIFDDNRFNQELKTLLESSLLSNSIDGIREFILSNKQSLTDPYEGEPLNDDWEGMIEYKDAHQYGDFALTKYYAPTADSGLGEEWESVQKILSNTSELRFSPVLGFSVGLGDELFDPGKMGSYFQSENEVLESLKVINKAKNVVPNNLTSSFNNFKKLLEQAVNENKGVYVTF